MSTAGSAVITTPTRALPFKVVVASGIGVCGGAAQPVRATTNAAAAAFAKKRMESPSVKNLVLTEFSPQTV
jgi:hypothetical protein